MSVSTSIKSALARGFARGYRWHTKRTRPVMVLTNRLVLVIALIAGAWLAVGYLFGG